MMRNQTSINLYVQPNARCNAIVGFKDGVLHVKVAAPPQKGEANAELINFISRSLGIGKSSMAIERGFTSRNKVVSITGLGRDDIIQRLRGLAQT